MMPKRQTAAPSGPVLAQQTSGAALEEFPTWLSGRLETIVDRWKIERPPLPSMYLEYWGRSAEPGR